MNNCIRVDFLSPYSVLYIRAEIHYTYFITYYVDLTAFYCTTMSMNEHRPWTES